MGSDAGGRSSFSDALESLITRRVVLFGGKGGVGKTTISAAAALHFARTRPTTLFTTDPASNLADLFTEPVANLTLESLDTEALYARFLGANLESFLELGDRGTYLDREELRRFFELSLPGIDELMAWMRIGELAEREDGSMLVVDTAPTGHTVRMLSSAEHFAQLAEALDAMQAKHRGMVRQFTRHDVRDAMDVFIDDFEQQAGRRTELLADPTRAAFVPVLLAEPWVVEQTVRLIRDVRADGLDVPFVLLNRAAPHENDGRCRAQAEREGAAHAALAPLPVVDVPRSCVPLDGVARLRGWISEPAPSAISASINASEIAQAAALPLGEAKLLFLAGKGGVGKTTSASSIALQLARAHPDRRYVILSVDPAHTLADVFATEAPPANLSVETIDTREQWRRFRATLGAEIERAVDAITPRGLSIAYDTAAMQKLIEIAPPGADELFAITRIAALLTDESVVRVIVDTAPTGHFLRLLELPRTAGEWVREFMRILLRYRELIAPGSLGEELVQASRALHALADALPSTRTAVIVVCRPERIVIAETVRLLSELASREIEVAAVIANYVTPPGDCPCDVVMRQFEMAALAALGGEVTMIARRDGPVTRLAELETLVPFCESP